MKLVKMSLVVAVAVASLSTASFAGAEISGNTDFRFKSVMTEGKESSKFVRDRIDLNVVTKSSDGNGKVHFKARAEKGEVGVNKAYATYKMMGMTVGAGPVIGSPGKLSFSNNSGVTLAKKVGGITVKAGAFREAVKGDKQIVSATGAMGPLTFAFDYQMGDENNMMTKKYLATVAHIKAGPAKVGFGYAMKMGNDAKGEANKATMLGLSAGMSVAGIGIKGGFNMSGKDQGGQIVEKKFGTGLPSELGDAYGAQSSDTTSFYAQVDKKVAGIKVIGYFSSATKKDVDDSLNRIMVTAVKKLNAQSSVKVRYMNTSAGDDKASNVMVFFKSKI